VPLAQPRNLGSEAVVLLLGKTDEAAAARR
jgi:hypothetical protein